MDGANALGPEGRMRGGLYKLALTLALSRKRERGHDCFFDEEVLFCGLASVKPASASTR